MAIQERLREVAVKPELKVGIGGLAEFLEQSKATVCADWNLQMLDRLGQHLDLFPDRDSLIATLEKDDFRQLEKLRYLGQADLWREILAELSQREVAILTRTKQTIAGLPDQEIAIFGLSRQEINLYLDLSRAVQPLVDAVHRQQLEKADQPGGKELGPHAKEDGYEYLYGDKPYIQEFSKNDLQDFSNLINVLNNFSEQIQLKVRQDERSDSLPSIYLKLAEYLKLLVDNFASHETDPKKLKENWDSVTKEFVKLAQSGCPIVLVPWGFMLDGGHIGMELMVALNLGEDCRYYQESSRYTSTVTEFMSGYDSNFTSIPFIHLYTLTRNGDCLPWGGTACAGEYSIVMYDYENDRYARDLYRYLTRYVKTDTTEEEFIYARAVNTIAHEIGHLGRMLCEAIYQRLGIGISVGKIDEAKADLMSIIFFLENQAFFNVSPSQYLEQYLVDYIKEFVNSKSHEDENIGDVWYGFSGKLILHHLFQCGAIVESGNKIKLVKDNAMLGLHLLAGIGKDIFGFYGDQGFTESELNLYVADYERKFADNAALQRFLGRLYHDHGVGP